uniref:F-box domain-containing protein n=1 Tax=Zooxanthella nutricula TaxID=1333877 RepID=A0A7S2KHX8_9DINO
MAAKENRIKRKPGHGAALCLPELAASRVLSFAESPQDLAALQATCADMRNSDTAEAWAAHCRLHFPTMAAKLDEESAQVNWQEVFSKRMLKQRQWDAKKAENSAEARAEKKAEKEAQKAAAQAKKMKEGGYRAKRGSTNRTG